MLVDLLHVQAHVYTYATIDTSTVLLNCPLLFPLVCIPFDSLALAQVAILFPEQIKFLIWQALFYLT